MKYGMTGSICRKTCARLGMSSEATLCNFPIRGAAKHTAKMFQFVYHSRGGLDIFLHRILVIKKITPLNCVVQVLLPTVRFRIP
jgi:hypothetical protein